MADPKQETTPYVDALLEYAKRETGRFQVPGHKGGLAADPAMVELVGMTGLVNDIPSVTEGVDIGPEPTPFQQAQLLAAGAWGARRSWFLVNGASQGNHATCMALGHMGEEVVVQRNVHSSVIDGLVLNGMRPTFVAPELDPDLGIAHGLTPESLAAALDSAPGAVAAMIVSPTYFGACADVAALADVAHSRGLPLIVDEAWGAHLHFHPDLPPAALESGADLVTSSTHKIVGSLTQAAMLHLGNGDRIDAAVVDRCVSLVETTSPSGLLSGSLDAARRQAAVHGEELLGEILAAIARTREADRPDPRPRRPRRVDGRPARRRRLGPDAPLDRRPRHRLDRLPAGEKDLLLARDRPRALLGERRRRDLRPRRARRRRPAPGWSPRCAPRSANSKPSPGRRRRSWRRRRPGASW